jgi:hypothetical protein
MDDALDMIEGQVGTQRNYESPPLHLWDPPLSGDIPIRIDRDGSWYHDGGAIEREALVRLFASILRREDDGDYYLVTPTEKWRISVDSHPLMVVDVEPEAGPGEKQVLRATLNTGTEVLIGKEHPISLDASINDVAVLELTHGLTAIFTRAAWYRLIDQAQENEAGVAVTSAGITFSLIAD